MFLCRIVTVVASCNCERQVGNIEFIRFWTSAFSRPLVLAEAPAFRLRLMWPESVTEGLCPMAAGARG